MNSYEQKQEDRRARYEARAAKLRRASDALSSRARQSLEQIPLGQPILVGHHSEKRHRNHLARVDRAMRRAIECDEKAKHYESKAAGVGTAGISSDDPDAPDKIRERLAELEAKRERMKKANATFRKHGVAALDDIDRKEYLDLLRFQPYHTGCVYPPYTLQNLGANIRRLQERVKQLGRVQAEPDFELDLGDGIRYAEAPSENRVRLYFPGKPSDEQRKALKQHGFRWSPTEGAWQRHYGSARMPACWALRGYDAEADALHARMIAAREAAREASRG